MATVICPMCPGPSWYNSNTGWWECAKGHGQILPTVIPAPEDYAKPTVNVMVFNDLELPK